MKVAVVGSGIAGISAAWRLQLSGHNTHLFEQSGRIGGHTHTHELPVADGVAHVDTGFIVFNTHNYPNFSRWLNDLGVASQSSVMSFAVSDAVGDLEYGTTSLRAVLANYGQLARPDFWRLWRDLRRFYGQLLRGDVPDITLGEYLAEKGYSSAFTDSHIGPMCSALWSQPAEETLSLSLRHVVQFMRNHRMLQVFDRPEWRVVDGGSSSYLSAFADRFGGHMHTHTAIGTVRRQGAQIVLDAHPQTTFDGVVVACHSDQALALLADPSTDEQSVLGAIPYQHNDVFLHEDASFMPRNRACWSSWNVVRDADGRHTITYWMNRLQGLTCKEQFFVTLNPPREPRGVRWQGSYQHPHFTRRSFEAQQRWQEISAGRTQFAGAYWGSGFHEDGFVSGERAALALIDGALKHAA